MNFTIISCIYIEFNQTRLSNYLVLLLNNALYFQLNSPLVVMK